MLVNYGDYVLDFPEFREISLLDRTGAVLATSSFSKSAATVPPAASVTGDLYVSPLRLDDDFLPTATLGVSTTTAHSGRTWIVGEIALEELWRMVDRIRAAPATAATRARTSRRRRRRGSRC